MKQARVEDFPLIVRRSRLIDTFNLHTIKLLQPCLFQSFYCTIESHGSRGFDIEISSRLLDTDERYTRADFYSFA